MKPSPTLVATAAALCLLGLSGAIGYKAFRYRQDSKRWHDRWLSLHCNPAALDRFRADNARLDMQLVPIRALASKFPAPVSNDVGSQWPTARTTILPSLAGTLPRSGAPPPRR